MSKQSINAAYNARMPPKSKSSCALGIDLGSTFTCCAVSRDRKDEVIPNELGARQTPSIVSFKGSDILIGEAARSQQFSNPSNTITDIKGCLGLHMKELQDFIQSEDLAVVAAEKNGGGGFEVEYQEKKMLFSVEEVTNFLLTKVKIWTDQYIKQNIKGVVVSVPAAYTDKQRQAIKDAGISSGLQVLRVATDATMAATAYSFDQQTKDTFVLVFDMSANSLSITILLVEEGIFEVVINKTSRNLGGKAFDALIAEHLLDEFNQKFKVDVHSDRQAVTRVRLACEKVRISIPHEVYVNIDIPSLFNKTDFKTTLTKAKYGDITSGLFNEIDVFINDTLSSAASRVKAADIKNVVMVGGGSKMKRIQELVQRKFSGARFHDSIDPQEVIAIGCARLANELSSVSSEKLTDLLLLDVEPLSLGVETAGGVMTTIFPRNTTIPGRKAKTFATMFDNQESMTFKVFEGERAFADDNVYVGMFDIAGINPSPRGQQTVDVTFDIDANGLLKITAEDKGSKRTVHYQTSEIKAQLDYEELEEMINDADRSRDSDTKELSRVRAKQNLEDLVYFVNSTLSKQDVDNESKNALNSKCRELSEWLEENGAAKEQQFESKRTELENACSKLRSTGSLLDNMAPSTLLRVPGRVKTQRKSKKVSWW